jgi:hypothetical protein
MNLYGDMSLNLGKTYKVIGTLYIIQNQPVEARDYLQRALAIFELKGNVKVQKEVKAKLKLLSQSSRPANIAMDFHEGSDYDSNGEINPQIVQKPQVLPHQQQAKKKSG